MPRLPKPVRKRTKKQVEELVVAKAAISARSHGVAKSVVVSLPEAVVVKPAPLLEIAVHDPTLVERIVAWITGNSV